MTRETLKKEIYALEAHIDYLKFEYSVREAEYELKEIDKCNKMLKSLYIELKETA